MRAKYRPLNAAAYTRGKAKTSTPPDARSQTSFPSQRGPIAASTVRRSASVRATNVWTMPAPKSKPSRTA